MARPRLLPRDGFSWTGYIWLVYLSTPLWYAASGRASGPGVFAWTIVAAVAFLPLYFWGFWLSGRRALIPIAAIAVIGVGLIPINAGGFVFFVFAASFAGRVGRPIAGTLVLCVLLVVVAIEAWLVRLPTEAWGPALPLVVLIGGLNVVFLEIGRRQAKLRRAAEEDARRLAVVAERERIGRDLHDLLGHTLSVITLKAELASKLASRDPDRSIAEIREVERISREALQEVRRAVQGYGGSTLAGELRHARTALESAGAVLDCDVAPVSLSPAAEQALALSIREAVTNVIRHAHARRCEIRLVADGSSLRLDVRDDGKGGAAPDGSGLLGMRSRVVALGGRVEREGRDGTRVTVTLPIEAAVPAAVVPATAAAR
jgi:two-component system sensor histidine kinase DesK